TSYHPSLFLLMLPPPPIYTLFPYTTLFRSNECNSATPFAKTKWLKENEPSNFTRTASFLFSSKDFLIYHLTDKSATDVTTAATTGLMDMEKRAWLSRLVVEEGVSVWQLPDLHEPEEIAGHVT